MHDIVTKIGAVKINQEQVKMIYDCLCRPDPVYSSDPYFEFLLGKFRIWAEAPEHCFYIIPDGYKVNPDLLETLKEGIR